MVDCASYTKMVPGGFDQLAVPHPSQCLDDIPESELHFCPPTVLGYSFAAKKWGRLLTDKFSDIVWNMRAFERLVLSEQKKSLILSLVCADRTAMISDVISGKAGGSIIILHGKPGTGKTLTAEAASEIAKKPLMVISAAKLTDQAPIFEAYLQNILDICEVWGAILLIDEAEVCLEARTLGNPYRNSIVSVLLRLLEYHKEIIFLTTNHITRLDAAFQSRISVAIKYPSLDRNAQEEIWTGFLNMAGVQIIENEIVAPDPQRATFMKVEVRKLAGRDMNGR
jgi:ATPase family associated with various cellular activities (AAA)